MRFRNARVEDLDDCLSLLRNDGGFRAEEEIWAALPDLWKQLLQSESAASFQVFEKGSGPCAEIVAFRCSVFVTEAYADQFMASPHPQAAAEVWRQHLKGNSPILDRAGIARDNARGKLQLAVLHWATRHRDPRHEETLRILSMVPAAWQVAHGGYRLERLVFYEMFYEAAAEVMINIGYRVHQCAPDPCNPLPGRHANQTYVFHWPREKIALGQGAIVTSSAHPSLTPQFKLTVAQQRLILAALAGLRDREIAEDMGIRYDTVRHSWNAIYKRIDQDYPSLLGSEPTTRGRRGDEKRRVLVEYMRQHQEELRPYDWSVHRKIHSD